MQLTSLKNRGDTIVEVMIVLAILGLAISISYATANKSLLATRAAQESAQATVLLKTQVENLRILSSNGDKGVGGNNIFSSSYAADGFCIVTSDVPAAQVKSTTDATNACKRGIYDLVIKYDNPTNKFVATAAWDDVSGKPPIDSATIVYKPPYKP